MMDIFEKTRLALREHIKVNPEKVKADLIKMREKSKRKNMKNFTGILDLNGEKINRGSILITKQKTKFLVIWNAETETWSLIQMNKGSNPELQSDLFPLDRFMNNNLEVIGSIFETPELLIR